MRISDWSSDVCSSDLAEGRFLLREHHCFEIAEAGPTICLWPADAGIAIVGLQPLPAAAERQILFFRQTAACLDPIFGGMTCQPRSEEHTSELQSLMRISYAVFCLNKKKQETKKHNKTHKTS